MANFETIGGRIIEVHLRFADQWPDLYGTGWVDALIAPLCDGAWRFDDRRGAPATASCSSCRTAGAIAIRPPSCNAGSSPGRRVEPADHLP